MIAPALRNGVVRGGWLPAAVLVVGLAAVAAAVLGSDEVSLARVHQNRADWGLYSVGHYPGVPHFPQTQERFSSVLQGQVGVMTFVVAIIYLSAATAVGSLLVDALRGDDRWPPAVSALAGFLPGYVMVLGPLQLLFAAIPYREAAWLALLGLPLVAVILHRPVLAAAARALRHDGTARRRLALAALAIVATLAVAAVHRLQAGNFFLTQDSLLWWLAGANRQLSGEFGGHLAQWDQQTDEWVFGAPLLFRSYSDLEALVLFYATQCLGLVSFACLVFGLVHRMAWRREMLAACLAVALVLASTPLIYPWRYITISGGDNPVLWTGQVGRQVGIVAPWAAMLLIGRQRRVTVIAAGLATAGLAFTSMPNALYVLVAVGATLAWRTLAGHGASWITQDRRGAALLLPATVVAMIVYAFWWLHQTPAPTNAVWWLLASVVLAVAGATAIGLGTTGRRAIGLPKGSPVWLGAWIVVLAGGFILSNNATGVFGGEVRHLLASVLPGYGEALLVRPDIGADISGGFTFPAFSSVGCDYFSYCAGFKSFLGSFGFLLVLVLATWLALGRMTTDAANNARRVALLLMVAALAMTFTVMFFTGAEVGLRPSILSRALDVPYYGLLALAAMTFVGASNRATMKIGVGVLVVWSVVPLIGSQWPEQMARNGAWLLSHAGLV